MRRGRHHKTIDDRTKLAVLVAEGKHVDEIAKHYGVSSFIVYKELDRHRLARPVEILGNRRQKRTWHVCPSCKRDTSSRSELCVPCRNKVKRWLVRAEMLRHLGGGCTHCGFVGDPSSYIFLKSDGRPLQNSKLGNTSLATQIKLLEDGKAMCSNCHKSLLDSGTGTEEFQRALAAYSPKKKTKAKK